MSKKEKREWLARNSETFGNAVYELNEINRLQEGPDETDLATLSAGCSGFLTLACC